MSALSQTAPVQSPERISPPSAPATPPSRRPWKLIGFLVLLAVGGYAVYNQLGKQKQEQQAAEAAVAVRTAKVTTGNLLKTMRLGGQTSAREYGTVVAPRMQGVEGNRDLVLMKVTPSGQFVKKGTLLAQIDGQNLQDHIDDLNDTIEAAQADVRKRKAEQGVESEALLQTLRVAKSAYDKAKLDASAGEVRTDIERQLLNLTLEEADARYKQQQADLAQKAISQKAELRILEFTEQRHVRHRERHLVDITRFSIHASMDGLSVMTPVIRGGEMGQFQEGDRVSPGQVFMKIVNPRTMQVEASVNQTQSGDFRIGQKAKIRFDAFPGLEMDGKVYSIGALAVGGTRQNFFIRTVPVRLTIEGLDPRIIPDLSASADVILGGEEGKTLVPLNAVSEEGSKFIAYVKNGLVFEKRELKIGLKNDLMAVVESGLKTGEEVRLNQ